MCGIAGWVSFTRDLTVERDAIEAMTATMQLRGPDAGGVWTDRRVGLGHRRLAVIDVEGGVQPMRAETAAGPVVLTFSGEVYNYRELRAELRARGQEFDTSSDTEVVLRAYLEWGDDSVKRLNGMFAFALWDGRSERLLLVRDRLGVKPLLYAATPDGVLFGSEHKALLAHPSVDHRVDIDGLRQLFMYTRPPETAVWRGMRQVRPGTMLVVDAAGLRTRTYWRLDGSQCVDDLQGTVARVEELLSSAVTRQLVSDVPLCVLLSGGLDSSVVTALAARASDASLRSIAVDFVGDASHFVPDELRGTRDADFVHGVARHVGTRHQDVVLDSRRLSDPDLRRAVVAARDLPMGLGDLDSSLYLLSQAIREHSTVALSGESADEVFGGYTWFHDPAVRQVEMFPWYTAMQPDPEVSVALLRPELAKRMQLTEYVRQCYRDAVAQVPEPMTTDPLERRMLRDTYLNLTHWLPYLLERKDRMSMANGLEVRVPFCDHGLVEYVFATSWAQRTFDGREKSLLRAAGSPLLPDNVVRRRKSQYPTTQDPAYLVALQQQAKNIVAEPDHPVFEMVDPGWATRVAQASGEALGMADRRGLERLLDLAIWMTDARPAVRW
ncbi:asparagine synthase (glutamine-hydrolyzing) [Salinispora pacifica]|uniref:asparagine synthase (glutamine-hydrolyzing) n=1 Tax=Salinispora pacifica TaxID=351187 RepID=UPI0003813BE0|nr:asparagine synthase (glutamine-hydrolyzing) [Salinispora pacifica]